MVSRVTSHRTTTPKPAAEASKPKAVTTATKNKLKTALTAALKTNITWGQAPVGVRFVRVPLKAGRGDQYSYTALIPVGVLKPGAKTIDPNKATGFLIERSGGLAGTTTVSGPFSFAGKPLTKKPFFDQFLQGSGGTGGAVTEKYPSDAEDGGGGRTGGGSISTMKYPSDNEDGGGGRTGGTGGAVTEKYPSDAEDGGGGRTGGSGGAVTEKYPSDAEDGGGGRSGGAVVGVTEKYPSDAEDR